MPVLLHIDSSADLRTSRSRAITSALAASWRGRGEDFAVTYRDLHRDPLPHLPDPALHWAPGTIDGAAAAAAGSLQATLIEELLKADAVVLGAPLYNYSMPSTLKAWVDYIHVPGITTPFGDEQAPLAGRHAVVVTSRGAIYDPGSEGDGRDHCVPPLRLILGDQLRMVVTAIATSRTLSEAVPGLASERDRAHAELERALQQAAELGGSLPVL